MVTNRMVSAADIETALEAVRAVMSCDLTSTDIPGAKISFPLSVTAIFTGTRCVILVKLPVSLSTGSKSKVDWSRSAQLDHLPVKSFTQIGVDPDIDLLSEVEGGRNRSPRRWPPPRLPGDWKLTGLACP